MSIAMVIDCRSRNLQMFSASVTTLKNGLIILRKAAELGSLYEMPEGEIPQTVMFLGDYTAQSSAGFIKVARPSNWFACILAGACGLGWNSPDGRRGDALRPIKNRQGGRFSLVVIEGGCTMTRVGVHQNSNRATAAAAVAGMEFRAEMREEIVLIEGQSDAVLGWAFKPNQEQCGMGGEFPPEHRVDVFDAH